MKLSRKLVIGAVLLIVSIQAFAIIPILAGVAFAIAEFGEAAATYTVVEGLAGEAIITLADFVAASASTPAAGTAAAAAWDAGISGIATVIGGVSVLVAGKSTHEFVFNQPNKVNTYTDDAEAIAYITAQCNAAASNSACQFSQSVIDYCTQYPNSYGVGTKPYYSCLAATHPGCSSKPIAGASGSPPGTQIYSYLEQGGSDACLASLSTVAPVPSKFFNVTGTVFNRSVYQVVPADGVKRWISSGGGWVPDPTDMDWRGVTKPDPVQSVRFQSTVGGNPVTTSVTNNSGNVEVTQSVTSYDSAKSKSSTTVKDFQVSPSGSVVYNVSNTYLNIDPNTVNGSGSTPVNVTVTAPPAQVNFPDDYVKSAQLFDPQGYLSQTELHTRKISEALDPSGAAPDDPFFDVSDFSSVFFGGTFDGLLSFRPNLAGSCPPFHFDLTAVGMGSFSTSAHCDLMAQNESVISAIGIVFWTLGSLFIVLGA